MKVTVVTDDSDGTILEVFEGSKTAVRNSYIKEELEGGMSGDTKREATEMVDDHFSFEEFTLRRL